MKLNVKVINQFSSSAFSTKLIPFLAPLILFLLTNLFLILTKAETPKPTAEGYEELKLESQDTPLIPPNQVEPKPTLPPPGKFPKNIIHLGNGDYFSKFAFIADKSTRTLTVWQNQNNQQELVAAYAMDLGKNPGNKTTVGDLKTPEGVYFFNKSYSKNELDFNEYGNRAFVMDYPNFYDQIDQKTGSGIWLHAVPPTKTLLRGSRGCLVLNNNDIEKVEPYIQMPSTPIIVDVNVEYAPAKEINQQNLRFTAWLNQWKDSWQSKKINEYIEFYHDNFRSGKMKKTDWYKYKNSLNEKYQFINLKFFSPVAFRQNNRWVIKFLQKYQSDSLSDFGEKTLYVVEEKAGFKIIGEEWAQTPREVVAKYNNCTGSGC